MVVDDLEFGFVFDEAACDGNRDDAPGWFDELERLGGGGKFDREVSRNEGAGGRRGRVRNPGGVGPGIAEDRRHEEAGQAHGDRETDGPENWISAHRSVEFRSSKDVGDPLRIL